MAALLMILAAPAPAPAQGVTAEEAIEKQRRMLDPPAEEQCAEASLDDKIVVCGRRSGNSFRVPDEPTPGDRIVGHVASGTEAMADAGRCISRCPQPLGINIIKAVPTIIKGIGRLFGNE
jgi:hypothetical protein